MSPILLRPIREQFEHDRVIRQLQGRWRRRFTVGINPGAEETASIRIASRSVYPDLLLTSPGKGGRPVQTIIEVETTESVNHLEALAQWAHLAKARGAFHLYVPGGTVDVARRLCQENAIGVAEIWTYYSVGTKIRFAMVYRSAAAVKAAKKRKAVAAAGLGTKKKKASKTKRASETAKGRRSLKVMTPKKSSKASESSRKRVSKVSKKRVSKVSKKKADRRRG